MFIAALFLITKIGKQLKCPSVDEWMKHLWDIYTVEYYPAIKKRKFMLSEINQSEKDKYHMISLICGI